jgi:cell wall-associated NlpC family hydrolase
MPVPIWAGHYIGLPFKDHGRDRAGLDCWGLVRLVMSEQFSRALPSFTQEYRRTTQVDDIGKLIEREIPSWDALAPGEEEKGDVIVLRIRGRPMHVGLVLGDRHMLHVECGVNSVIERYTGPRWADRIFGFYRYKAVSGHEDTAGGIFGF